MWLKTDTGGGVCATASDPADAPLSSTIGSSLCSPMLQHHARFQLGRSGQHIVSRQRWHCEGRTDAASAPDSRWQRGRRIPPRIGCTPCPCGACTGPPQKLSAHTAQYAATGLTQVAENFDQASTPHTALRFPRHVCSPCNSRRLQLRSPDAQQSVEKKRCHDFVLIDSRHETMAGTLTACGRAEARRCAPAGHPADR